MATKDGLKSRMRENRTSGSVRVCPEDTVERKELIKTPLWHALFEMRVGPSRLVYRC